MNIMMSHGWTPSHELAVARMYRLTPRGGGGLACDKAGVALGAAELVRVGADAEGRRRCEVRPPQALARILSAAYGPQPEEVVLRLHRGLRRAATAIEVGDLCLAGIETVLLGLPDLTPSALAKLAKSPSSRKAEQRGKTSRASRPDSRAAANGRRGRRGGAPAVAAKPAADVSPHGLRFPPKSTAPARRRRLSARDRRPAHHPDRRRRGRRGVSPVERAAGRLHASRRRVPRPQGCPGLAIPLAPVDGFFGVSALADEANLEATRANTGSGRGNQTGRPHVRGRGTLAAGRDRRPHLAGTHESDQQPAHGAGRRLLSACSATSGPFRSRRCGSCRTPSTPPTRKP